MSSSETEEYDGCKINDKINITKSDYANIKENVMDQVISSTNEINIAAISNDTTPTTSLSSIKLSSNSNSVTNSFLLNDHKLQFCSSNSSLNTSLYEMNQVIDLAKNEYLAKTSLNSPNKLPQINNNNAHQLDLFINTDATITNERNQEYTEPLRRSIRLAHLYNNGSKTNNLVETIKVEGQVDEFISTSIESPTGLEYNQAHQMFKRIDSQNESLLIHENMTCERKNDILLSNALSIDTSENFLKCIDSITTTTATTSTTSTNDNCNGDPFLSISQSYQQPFLSNSFDGYTHQTNDFNDLIEKNFNNFENDLLETHDLNRVQYNFSNNNDDQSTYSLLRTSSSMNYINISNNKHDVSIGTDLSISRDIRCT